MDLAVVHLQNHEFNFAHSFYHLSLSLFQELGDIVAWSNRDESELEDELTTARTVLGEEQFQSERSAGLNMMMEEAIRFGTASVEILY